MKKLKCFGKYVLPVFIWTVLLCSCEENNDPAPPDYVGTWMVYYHNIYDTTIHFKDSLILSEGKSKEFVSLYHKPTDTYNLFIKCFAAFTIIDDSIMDTHLYLVGMAALDGSGKPTGNIELVDENDPRFSGLLKYCGFADKFYLAIYTIKGDQMIRKADYDDNNRIDYWEIDTFNIAK